MVGLQIRRFNFLQYIKKLIFAILIHFGWLIHTGGDIYKHKRYEREEEGKTADLQIFACNSRPEFYQLN